MAGCHNKHDARGYCSTHYIYAVGAGEIPAGSRLPALTSDGYVLLFMPGHPNAQKTGHVKEHTFVMGAMLGRPLFPGENVHHMNGVRSDNRPENLELWVGRGQQPKGQRPEDLVVWAKELLARYDPDALA